MRKSIERILEGISEHIDRGEYRVLIGDDASGRIPALILGKNIKNIYASRDLPSPVLKFIAGTTRYCPEDQTQDEDIKRKLDEKATRVKNFLASEKIKGHINGSGRVLIVTDSVQTSASIRPIWEELESMDIEFDIATIGASYLGLIQRDFPEIYSRLYYVVTHDPEIYAHEKGSNRLGGVRKEPENLHSVKTYNRNQKQVNLAREDVEKLANQLSDWYISRSTE
jgi:hypothetical protein